MCDVGGDTNPRNYMDVAHTEPLGDIVEYAAFNYVHHQFNLYDEIPFGSLAQSSSPCWVVG